MRSNITILLGAALLGGCANGMNYTSATGPRFASPEPLVVHTFARDTTTEPVASPETIKVVSFNVMYGEQIDSVLALLREDDGLRDPDVIVMQEMNEDAAATIGEALGMHYVYYPAVLHPVPKKNFGNAIFSRWPIVEDEKIILPHISWQRRTQRAAVAATVLVGQERVRVYAVHLSTPLEIWYSGQKDQARLVLSRAGAWDRVIIAGDFNSHGLVNMFAKAGYAWPTKDNGATHRWFNVDHVLSRGFIPLGTGKVQDTRGASDHRPVGRVLEFANAPMAVPSPDVPLLQAVGMASPPPVPPQATR